MSIATILNIVGTVFAALSASYWYKSATTKLPPIDPSTGKPSGPLSMLDVNLAILESSKANKVAAMWTAASVGVMAVNMFMATPCKC